MMKLTSFLRSGMQTFIADRKGVTMIEFAFVFPVFSSFILSLVYVGFGFFGVQQAQHATEGVARMAYTLNNPTAGDIENLIMDELGITLVGTFTPTVQLVEKYGQTYADVDITYAYDAVVPFLPQFNYETTVSSQVLIREIPLR